MIADWIAAVPVILVAALIVFLPGILSLAAAGMRGLALVAFAPIMTTAVVSAGAVALGLLGIPWALWSVAVVVLVVGALSWGVGRILPLRRHQVRTDSRRWMLPTVLVIGALIGFWRLGAYLEDPAAISQTNDAVFHLNALRHILDTGSASSLDVNAVIGASGFYPAAWHALASLIALATGASIPIAANALSLVIAGLIWPLGIAWLARAVSGSHTVAAYAAVLSGALQAFPLLLLQWGVLYPNALSVALLPAAIAAALSLPTWSASASRAAAIAQAVVIIGIASTALAFAQPTSVLIFGLVCMLRVTAWAFVRSGAGPALLRWTVAVAGWVVLVILWRFFTGSTGGSHWAPFRGRLDAGIDVLVNGHLMMAPAWGISILMLVGLVSALVHPARRWFVAVWAVLSTLYVLVAAFGNPLVRDGLLGAWYADPYRIVALAPLAVIPLAAIGAEAIVRIIATRIRRPAGDDGHAGSVIGLAAVSALMIVIALLRPVAMPDYVSNRFEPAPRYEESDVSYLSIDERDLLESLDDLVADDALIIGNPSTGMGFGYLFSGVDVFPRTWAPPNTTSWWTLAGGLRDAASDPAVCDALEAYGSASYVLDFGLGEAYAGRYEMPGMTHFEGQPGFEPVAAVGDASLWRITACGW